MRNKIFDHFLQISNVSFILGIVISAILLNYGNPIEWGAKLFPFYIFTIIALVCATIFAFYRKNYFILISQHLTPKSIKYYKISVYFLFFNIFVSIVLMLVGTLAILPKNQNFFTNIYLYIILAIEMLLTLADVVMDSISRLKIKLDLSIKRGGADELLAKGIIVDGEHENESNTK